MTTLLLLQHVNITSYSDAISGRVLTCLWQLYNSWFTSYIVLTQNHSL